MKNFKSLTAIMLTTIMVITFYIPVFAISVIAQTETELYGISSSGGIIANHNNAKLADLLAIPDEWITKARTDLHIYYNHTSHGSQVADGMSGLATFKGSKYAWNGSGSGGALHFADTYSTDLGNGSWPAITENYLTSHPSTNVVMWSWCGQVSGASSADITNYLNSMNQLEIKYPAVKFVYMTGHTDGSGVNGTLNTRNEQIRTYCKNNNKPLFDFADIESYDPSGNYYLNKAVDDGCAYDSDGNGSRDKNWATDWQASHTKNVEWYSCGSAHSQPVNANMKAYAAWYMWARLAGWDGGSTGGGSAGGGSTGGGSNNAPVLAAIGAKTVNEGSLLRFTISSADTDANTTLTYSIKPVIPSTTPEGVSFNAATRTFSWTPSNTQSGNYTIRFAVNDGTLTDFEDTAITVNDVPVTPVGGSGPVDVPVTPTGDSGPADVTTVLPAPVIQSPPAAAATSTSGIIQLSPVVTVGIYEKKTYIDIDKAYGKANIEALASKGFYNWIEGESFKPNRNITRGEFIHLLVTALDLHATAGSNFMDVKTTDFYYESAGIAKKLGISNGTGNNRLGANLSITRQDMSALIVRALKVAGKNYPEAGISELSRFNDADKIVNYAKESLATLVKAGILKGYNKNLDPGRTFTMQEAAVVIYRIYNK